MPEFFPVLYQDVQVGEVIRSDNHMKKLNFLPEEKVVEVLKYKSKGNGDLVVITFESGNKTYGFPHATLVKII